jgi:hypothetical protein
VTVTVTVTVRNHKHPEPSDLLLRVCSLQIGTARRFLLEHPANSRPDDKKLPGLLSVNVASCTCRFLNWEHVHCATVTSVINMLGDGSVDNAGETLKVRTVYRLSSQEIHPQVPLKHYPRLRPGECLHISTLFTGGGWMLHPFAWGQVR